MSLLNPRPRTDAPGHRRPGPGATVAPRTAAATALALLLALLAACSSAPPAPPAEPARAAPPAARQAYPYEGGRIETDTRGGACVLTLMGQWNAAASRRLIGALQVIEAAGCRSKQALLQIDGGVVNEAITAGSSLRNRGYDTRLPADARCGTACLMVFAAGRERLMAAGDRPARVGFEQLPPDQDFGRGSCETELNRAQELTLTRYLRAVLPAASASAVYQKLIEADCRSVAYYGPAESRAIGLATATPVD